MIHINTFLPSWYLLEPSPISNIRPDLTARLTHYYNDEQDYYKEQVSESTLLSLAYWRSILQQFNKELNSKVLKMVGTYNNYYS